MGAELVPADTTPEAARVHLEIIRRMSPEKRLELAFRMSESLRNLTLEGVRQREPGLSEHQARLAVIRLSLGEKLFCKVYPQEAGGV